jgi:hypothetical protein
LLAAPTTALLRALIAIADVASRVPVTIDGRRAWGIIALAAVTAALFRGVRRRSGAVQERASRAGYPGEQRATGVVG